MTLPPPGAVLPIEFPETRSIWTPSLFATEPTPFLSVPM